MTSRMEQHRVGAFGWGNITGFYNTTERAKNGTKSLKFTVIGANQWPAISVANPAIGGGKTVSAWVWVPSGSDVSTVKAIIYNSSGQIAANSSDIAPSL